MDTFSVAGAASAVIGAVMAAIIANGIMICRKNDFILLLGF